MTSFLDTESQDFSGGSAHTWSAEGTLLSDAPVGNRRRANEAPPGSSEHEQSKPTSPPPWAGWAPMGEPGRESAAQPNAPGSPAAAPQSSNVPSSPQQLFAHYSSGLGTRGMPLPSQVRERIETATGACLAGVRLQTDEHAAALAASVDAAAFTLGQDIFLGSGQYQPDTPEGQDLLMHEAAHTLQQTSSERGPATAISEPGAADECEADAVTADAWLGRKSPAVQQRVGRKVQRRKLSQSEQTVFKRLQTFAQAAAQEEAANPQGDPALGGDISAMKADLETQIENVKEEKISFAGFSFSVAQDPAALKAALWALHQWAGQSASSGAYAHSQALPSGDQHVQGLDANSYKCNRFVGDAYAIGAGTGYDVNGKGGSFPAGERDWMEKLLGKTYGYPPSANELADPSKQIPNLAVTQTPVAGDIVAFGSPGGIGHSGLNLGHNLFISARDSSSRPVPSMQPRDGVHIKRPVAGGVFRHYTG